MTYNLLTANPIQVNTIPTFYSTFLPTITYLYPSQSLSSLNDFHYNCIQPFTTFPIIFNSQTHPTIHSTVYNQQQVVQVKNKIKKSRNRDQKKELESAKKNSESNLVNQLFSYFNNYQKSQKIVEKSIRRLNKYQNQIQKIKGIFYNTVRLINFKRGRKYVNKSSILSYYSSNNPALQKDGIAQQLQNLKCITVEDFCFLFRLCTSYFFKIVSPSAILTSKRITAIARRQHLKRRRRVLQSLRDHDLN